MKSEDSGGIVGALVIESLLGIMSAVVYITLSLFIHFTKLASSRLREASFRCRIKQGLRAL